MGPISPHGAEADRRKRALRAEIARLRRRINRSSRELSSETHRLLDWRTHLRRYAPMITGAALAAGFLLASSMKRLTDGRARGRGVGLLGLAWRLAFPSLARRAIRLASEILAAPETSGAVSRQAGSDEANDAKTSIAFERPPRPAAGSGG